MGPTVTDRRPHGVSRPRAVGALTVRRRRSAAVPSAPALALAARLVCAAPAAAQSGGAVVDEDAVTATVTCHPNPDRPGWMRCQ
ncbi:MAG: hypothetical protein HOY79_13675 [Streptomyces sp.]|nr:hypothetical protein [Streptomyces sp.]